MSSVLELYNARVSYLRFAGGEAEIHFSYAYIYKAKGLPGRDPGTGWSQEAVLLLEAARMAEPLPPLPNIVAEGYLDVGGSRYELIPLPFERENSCLLYLEFTDATVLEIRGEHPLIKLVGDKVFLEDFT